MFNDKVMCLFKKTKFQVCKEACRRGISCADGKGNLKDTSRIIAEIIYKDAYDLGKINGLKEVKNNPPCNKYLLSNKINEKKYAIELTHDQFRLLRWLDDNNLIVDCDYEIDLTPTIQYIGKI